MSKDQITEALDLRVGARGRKEQDGQPAVVKLESLQTKVDSLVKLCVAADDASRDFKEAVNAVAEAAGLNAATVSKFIKAKAGEKFDETKEKVLQLALVFEEIGA